MNDQDSLDLQSLGWTKSLADHLGRLAPGLLPARVSAEDRGRFHLLGPGVAHDAVLAGRLQHAATSRLDLPAVGDWVATKQSVDGSVAVITEVLPRHSRFVRQAAGKRTEPVVIAANVDFVAVVTSLNQDFNPQRLLRYLSVVTAGGAQPLIILSKADLVLDPTPYQDAAQRVARGAPVLLTSGRTGAGLAVLRAHVQAGQTLAFVGSSGVGKSSLLNGLLGEARQATGASRVSDDRGRHVTTRRELFVLEGGGLVIDTPGLRELAAWAGEDGGDPDDAISALAPRCRFGNCQHQAEPGCAVQEAIRSGELDEDVLAAHRKLEKELRFQARKQDIHAELAERKRWKAIGKSHRSRPGKELR